MLSPRKKNPMHRHTLLALLTASGLAALARAQVVHQEIVVGQGAGPSVKCTEPAVAVSQANPGHIAVVWHQHDGSPGGIPSYNVPHYAFSTDAGLSFGSPTPMDLTGVCAPNAFDPIVVASPVSSRMYFGAIGTNPDWGPVLAAPRSGSSTTFNPAMALTSCPTSSTPQVDKPWFAVGPGGPSPGAPEVAFVGWGRFEPVGSSQFWNLQYSKSADHGATWSAADYIRCGRDALNNPVKRSGIGVWPYVVRHGLTHGRVFVSYMYFEASVGGFLPHLPEWTHSDDGGVNWTQAQRLDTFGIGQSIIYDTIGYQNLTTFARARSFPSVDADPNSTENLFVAFAARADQNDPNTDIFIMRSADAGTTFLPLDRFRIPDAALRLPGEASVSSHEFMPAICIDGAGGVNLMFARIEMGDGPTGDWFPSATPAGGALRDSAAIPTSSPILFLRSCLPDSRSARTATTTTCSRPRGAGCTRCTSTMTTRTM